MHKRNEKESQKKCINTSCETKLWQIADRDKDAGTAVVEFESESAAKTALLLSNALITDKPIIVTPYSSVPKCKISNTTKKILIFKQNNTNFSRTGNKSTTCQSKHSECRFGREPNSWIKNFKQRLRKCFGWGKSMLQSNI